MAVVKLQLQGNFYTTQLKCRGMGGGGANVIFSNTLFIPKKSLTWSCIQDIHINFLPEFVEFSILLFLIFD